MNKNTKIRVAVLGATGTVGQKFIELLQDHPYFEISELAASERSSGKEYREAVNWILPSPIPDKLGQMRIKSCQEPLESLILFSGLDASVAGEIESRYAEQGHFVISNSRNHRFDQDVPLLIPEVNPSHLELLKSQKTRGGIVTNPNCSTIGLVIALKPLLDSFGLEAVNVVTMQALSGAGYPGVPSLSLIDNLIPFISGEESKMETEPLKILGSFSDGKINPGCFKISAQCNRVAVIDGHTETVQVKLKKKASVEEVKSALENFRGLPQDLGLPSAPLRPIHYFGQENYPQPRLHRNLDKGMAVSVGRLRECPIFDYKFVLVSHNTARGAAGGAILNAELMLGSGYFGKNN